MYNQKTGEYIRHCKQCGEVMAKPLEVEDEVEHKLFMFCSTHCHKVWNAEHAYRKEKTEDAYID